MSELLENYEKSEGTIRKLYDSKLRIAILDALSEGPMRLADLRREVGSNAPNASSKSKELEDMGLIQREGGEFSLTVLGRVVRNNIEKQLAFYSTLETFKGYWLSRRLDFIPKELWEDIGALKDSEVVKSAQLNTTHTHDRFVEKLRSIKKSFKGISPIFHPDYLSAMEELMAKGADIELIVSPQVLQGMMGKLPPEEAMALASYPKLKLYVCDGLDSGITVGDDFVNLCIVSKTDVVSLMDQYLYSKGAEAVAWGNKLFDYYRSKSKRVEL